jgi:predicted transcriptional regulator of viral defense system
MRQIDALAKLTRLGQPVFETKDAAACLQVTPKAASTILRRLAGDGFVFPLNRPKWVLAKAADKLTIAEHLTAPHPSYVSLQSALFYHGMISQIPEVTYCVSLSRTRRYETPLGAFSIHHIDPDFFFGFEPIGKAGASMASPEKALLDILYLSTARSLLFKTLPELEIPPGFQVRKARAMIERIRSRQRRSMVSRKFDALLQTYRSDRTTT